MICLDFDLSSWKFADITNNLSIITQDSFHAQIPFTLFKK